MFYTTYNMSLWIIVNNTVNYVRTFRLAFEVQTLIYAEKL